MTILKNYTEYIQKIFNVGSKVNSENIQKFKLALDVMIENDGTLYICGNGGSAANAMHISNDFIYGASCGRDDKKIKVEALTSNTSILTCLANDIGYESIFEYQIDVKCTKNDIVLILSGSGNSENIIRAIKKAIKKNILTVGIFGYDGGKALEIVDIPIHTPVDDMQISEDFQLIICHVIMQEYCKK